VTAHAAICGGEFVPQTGQVVSREIKRQQGVKKAQGGEDGGVGYGDFYSSRARIGTDASQKPCRSSQPSHAYLDYRAKYVPKQKIFYFTN